MPGLRPDFNDLLTWFKLAAGVWMLVMFTLAILPPISFSFLALSHGPWAHLLALTVLVLLLWQVMSFRLALLVAAGYAGLLEVLQGLIPYRRFEIRDVLLLGLVSVFCLAAQVLWGYVRSRTIG